LKGIGAAVEMRARVKGVSTAQPSLKVTGTVTKCDKVLEALVAEEPVKMRSMLKGLQYRIVIWEQRAVGGFLYLHPTIYGNKSSPVANGDGC
jgi:hypothetical protein